MPGAIAHNLHEGSRSEILADYLFSTFGTVSPVRRQDDFGIDLHCTLTEVVGKRAVVTDYYSVQVKSTEDGWSFKNKKEIRWLIEYPTPLFLACVNKQKGVLSVYQTIPRFLAGFWESERHLELTPSSDDEGHCAQWAGGKRFSLSAPILRVTLANLLDRETLTTFKQVLRLWVAIDRENCTLRRMGMLRFRMPQSYRVNEIPHTGIGEQGNLKPSNEQTAAAIRTMAEVLDVVGHQLLADGDRKSALYACLLLNHLRESRGPLFNDPERGWKSCLPLQAERTVASLLNEMLYPGHTPSYIFQGLDEVKQQLQTSADFARFIGKGTPEDGK